jgi:hypothetical protein
MKVKVPRRPASADLVHIIRNQQQHKYESVIRIVLRFGAGRLATTRKLHMTAQTDRKRQTKFSRLLSLLLLVALVLEWVERSGYERLFSERDCLLAKIANQVKGHSERYDILEKEQAQITHVPHPVNPRRGDNRAGGSYQHSTGRKEHDSRDKVS